MSYIFDKDINAEFNLELETLYNLCCAVNTPRSLSIILLIRAKQYTDIINLTIKSTDYENSFASIGKFKDDLLVTGFLSKSPNLDLGIDKTAEAIKTFYKGESQCEATNLYLRNLDVTSEEYQLLFRVKDQIHSILGPYSIKTTREIERNFRFGPGASTRITGSFITSDKYDGSPHLTDSLYPFYKSILGENWHGSAISPIIVEGNRYTTVPKNAKTDRGISIEPDLNIYVQLGVGAVIRSRLAAASLNLDTQADVNRSLASRAYAEQLATIDLASASDTVSAVLVHFLLPDRWFHILDLCRSKKTLIDGQYHINRKFSSMGNGFTFELETLIFLAVVRSVVPEQFWHLCSVFGDDIICPQSYSNEVIKVLTICGFVVNPEKSFLAGAFFESCGCDYFYSQPVRPFYARGSSEGIPYALQLANALRIYSLEEGYGCDKRFKKTWSILYKHLPKVYRNCNIPKSLGDIGLINEILCPEKASYHLEGYIVNTISPSPLKRVSKSFGYLLFALTRAGSPDPITLRNKIPIRGRLGKPVVHRTFVSKVDSDLGWVSVR